MRWGSQDEYHDLGNELTMSSADYGADSNSDEDIWDDSIVYTKPSTVYKYQFKDEESLITSDVFQKCLGQALAHKDKALREIQQELIDTTFEERRKCINLLNSLEGPPWEGAWGGNDTFMTGVRDCIKKLEE